MNLTSDHVTKLSFKQDPAPEQVLRRVWPYVFTVILLLPSMYWILKDQSVWPWDQAWYGEVTVDLWFTLMNEPDQWWKAMVSAFGQKAPGIAWVGQFFVPVGRLIASIEAGLLLSVMVVQLGTLVLTYKISQELMPYQEGIPVLGCVLIASAPLFIGMTHQYFSEPLQLFAVMYVYWIAVRSPSMERFRIVCHLLLAGGLALLSKVTSPIYCLVPAGLALYEAFRDRASTGFGRSFSLRQHGWIALVAGVVGGSTAAWYLRNFSAVKEYAKLASFSDFALDYGKADHFLNKLLYWVSATQKSMFLPEVFIVLVLACSIGMGCSVAGMSSERKRTRHRWTNLLMLGAVLEVVLVLSVFANNYNEENRFLLPLLPSVLIIFLWCVSFVPFRLGLLVTLVALLAQWSWVHAQALGLTQPSSKMSYWVLPIMSDDRTQNEVQRIIEITCNPKSEKRYNMTGIELPWLNANSLSFYTAKERLESKIRCYYTSLGYAEKDVTRAWDRLEEMRIAHFISLEEPAHPHPHNFLNQTSIPILNKIKTDERFAPKPFDSNLNVVVFERREDRP